MDFENNRRADIVRRNQRRSLEAREYKLMMIMFGITGYSSVMNLFVGMVHLIGEDRTIVGAILGLILGVFYGFAAYEMWFKSKPRWWLVVVPAVITMVVAVAAILAGSFAIAPLVLNAVLLALIPMRTRIQKSLDSMRQ